MNRRRALAIIGGGIGALAVGAAGVKLASNRSDKTEIYRAINNSGTLSMNPYAFDAFDAENFSANGNIPFLGSPSDFITNEFLGNMGYYQTHAVKSIGDGTCKIDIVFLSKSDENKEFNEFSDRKYLVAESMEKDTQLFFKNRVNVNVAVQNLKTAYPIPQTHDQMGQIAYEIRQQSRKDSSLMILTDFRPSFMERRADSVENGSSSRVDAVSVIPIPPEDPYNGRLPLEKHINTLLRHEWMHTLGAAHNAIRPDIMSSDYTPDEINRGNWITTGLTETFLDTLPTVKLQKTFTQGDSETFNITLDQPLDNDEQANITIQQLLSYLDQIGLSKNFGIIKSDDLVPRYSCDGVPFYREEDLESMSVIFKRSSKNPQNVRLKTRGRRLELDFPEKISSDYIPLLTKPLPYTKVDFN